MRRIRHFQRRRCDSREGLEHRFCVGWADGWESRPEQGQMHVWEILHDPLPSNHQGSEGTGTPPSMYQLQFTAADVGNNEATVRLQASTHASP